MNGGGGEMRGMMRSLVVVVVVGRWVNFWRTKKADFFSNYSYTLTKFKPPLTTSPQPHHEPNSLLSFPSAPFLSTTQPKTQSNLKQ